MRACPRSEPEEDEEESSALTTVSPALHASFMTWLGMKGTLKGPRPFKQWVKETSAKYSLPEWKALAKRQKLARQLTGVRSRAAATEALMEQFLHTHPQWTQVQRGVQ